MSHEDLLRVVRRKVIVKGSGGVSATITVTVERGCILVSIEPLFTSEAILDPEKIDELIRTLRQAAEDAKRMGRGERVTRTE